ncbi:MAG: hypothetical protein JNG84_14455 [Archangium sp.]|nr:hypothetical protein [Archangium sp.]
MSGSATAPVGFDVRVDHERSILRLNMWGFWEAPMAKDYDRAVRKALSEIAPPFAVLADISNYPPQKPEVQAVHGGLMAAAKAAGVCRAANLVSSFLSQNQIRRLSEESGLPAFSFYSDAAEATRWLEAGIAEARAAKP